MTKSALIPVCLSAALLCGCVESSDKPAKEPGNSVLHKTTQDIGKFDPNAKQEVSNQKIQATDPVTAPLAAYSPMMEKISIIEIDHAVALFNATEGRFPANYDEFMEKIIKANNIKLPVLPYGGKYVYDEKEHSLKVVRPAKPEQGDGAKKPADAAPGGAAPGDAKPAE
jgi:hypothetical protein